MSYDVEAFVAKRDAAVIFARTFLKGYLEPALGSRSKSEVDLLVFACMVEAKMIDASDPIYDIARGLNISTARVRSLVLNWQLRSASKLGDFRQATIDALKKTRFSNDGTLLTFGIESPLLREDIIARLKREKIFPDASFSKELVRLPVEAFVQFLESILDDATRKEVRAALVKDKLLPDKSFKALATGVLKKLGEKVAGEAAGALAKDLVDTTSSFLSGILSGDGKLAAKSIAGGDYRDI
jgi:hypothetical protein